MDKWLQHFVYRIEIGLQSFLLGTLLTFGVALLTVSFQAVKAAIANPIKALRYELILRFSLASFSFKKGGANGAM
jgi:putative ABC transport system permease protein